MNGHFWRGFLSFYLLMVPVMGRSVSLSTATGHNLIPVTSWMFTDETVPTRQEK